MDRQSILSNYSKEIKNNINGMDRKYSKENKSVTFESPDQSKKSINLIRAVKCSRGKSFIKRNTLRDENFNLHSRNNNHNDKIGESELIRNKAVSPSKRIYDLFVNDPYLINLRIRENAKSRKTPQPNMRIRKLYPTNNFKQNTLFAKEVANTVSEKYKTQEARSKSCLGIKQFSESLMNSIKNKNNMLLSNLNNHTFEKVKYNQIFESPSPRVLRINGLNFAKSKQTEQETKDCEEKFDCDIDSKLLPSKVKELRILKS